MNRLRSIWTALKTLAAAALCWAALCGTVLAAAKEKEEKGGGPTSWIIPYILVLLGVALGMMLVCRSARRRDRARPETYGDAKVALTGEKKKETKKKKKKKKQK